MKKAFILGLILLCTACEKDHSPTKPSLGTTGTFQVIIADKSVPAVSLPDSLNTVNKPAKSAILDQLEVRVLKSDNSVLASKTFTPSDGYFQVSMTVEAQNDLKVLCIGTFDGDVGYFGIDEDVDVQAGKTTIAVISGWTEPYLSQIALITPNPSTDGTYTVSWTQAPNATSYVLQEAENYQFAGATTVYSGSNMKWSASGKASGRYYYQVRASNTYDVTSSWSDSASVSVLKQYTISGTVTGADGVTVTLSGDASGSLVVKDGVSYSFIVEHGGNYTVTPSKTGYTFTPVSMTFNNVASNQTQDFKTTQIAVPAMASIPAGTFEMGDIQGGGYSNERPVHTVTLDGFEMSIYEVTQDQYEAVIGSNPFYFSGNDLPVEGVTWYDAVKFCNKLSDAAGVDRCYNESTWVCDFTKNGYRLPKEAEWEYACRAGTTTKYYTGNDESDLARAGWYDGNSSSKTHPVGQKEPNAWGLYDMHGNVWERCNDWYDIEYYSKSPTQNPTGAQTGSSRVRRGGSWDDDAYFCRSASRSGSLGPGYGYTHVGFRVVRRP
ncbi:formylglycine-generating enzyme family protein [Candidatus Latescibacterota bacterium]